MKSQRRSRGHDAAQRFAKHVLWSAGHQVRSREDCNESQIAPLARQVPNRRDTPQLRRWRRCGGTAGGFRAVPDRAGTGRTAEGRRAAAALGRAGRHRPGLPARRRDRARHPQGPGAAGARHHQRRHRIQRGGGPRARRAADRGGRAAADGRLRLRPEHGDCPGGRAEGHSLRDQHRGRAADHRAGLQVRVPQLPDRADDPRAMPSPTRRRSSRPPAWRRSRWCSCT